MRTSAARNGVGVLGGRKPRGLDLFCGAGGASYGYSLAGFEMTGVDNRPQPNYPFPFVLGDALEYVAEHGHEYDFIAASPPCQSYSVTASLHDGEYPDLVAETRRLLKATGLPYVIENVVGAPLENPVMLCGSSFGLGVRRHRLFEVSPPLLYVPPCAHYLQPEPIDVTGTGGPSSRPRGQNGGIHRKPRNLEHAREVMGIDWMRRPELSEAVPPAYTEFIGHQLMLTLLQPYLEQFDAA
jgi:DNA (cytosine-5)-methyltransferase 1